MAGPIPQIFSTGRSRMYSGIRRPGITVKPAGLRCLEATLASTFESERPAETVIPSSRSTSRLMFMAIVS